MSEHVHDASRLVAHRVTWERFPNETEQDARVICVGCLEQLGLYADPYQWDDGNWSLEVERWNEELYPFDPRAKLGEVCYRPAPDFPPSLNEIQFRRAERTGFTRMEPVP